MTQVLEGSGEFISVPNDINLISGAIDRMYEAARELDPLSKLRAIKSLGHIAAGVLEYSETVPNAYSDETNKLVLTPAEQTPYTESELSLVKDDNITPPDGVALVKESEDQSDPQLHVVKETEEIAQISSEDILPESDPELIKSQFPELKMTNREAQFMKKLCGSKGELLKKNDLCTGIEGSNAGIAQAFTKFILKLENSVYAEYFSATGKTAGRRFEWTGPDLSGAQPVEPESMSQLESYEDVFKDEDNTALEIDLDTETTVDIDHSPERHEQSRDALLAKLGITYSELYKSLSVKGIDLRLNPLSIKVILKIAEKGGNSTYRELVNDTELMQCDGSKAARELSASILEITTALKGAGVYFNDRPLMDNGKKIRKLELGNQTPSPEDVASRNSSFLAHGQM